MDRNVVKNLLSYAANNKRELSTFIDDINFESTTKGSFCLRDNMIKRIANQYIFEGGIDEISDLDIVFDDGYIFVAAKIKKIMTISLTAAIEIKEFTFNSQHHSILCSYNWLGQSIKHKAVNEIIQNIVKRKNLTSKGVAITNNTIAISLDRLLIDKDIPTWMELMYIGCDDGKIKIKFAIN